jgi:predicted DNA-binding transcriptional regulator AlpA
MARKKSQRVFSDRTITDSLGSNSERRFLGRVSRPPEAAKYLSLSPHTLAKQRLRGDGPPFVKLGPKAVGYLQYHLDVWLRARVRRSTCQRDATNQAASKSPAYRRRARLSHVTLRREP